LSSPDGIAKKLSIAKRLFGYSTAINDLIVVMLLAMGDIQRWK
jgi:hypothetical protein